MTERGPGDPRPPGLGSFSQIVNAVRIQTIETTIPRTANHPRGRPVAPDLLAVATPDLGRRWGFRPTVHVLVAVVRTVLGGQDDVLDVDHERGEPEPLVEGPDRVRVGVDPPRIDRDPRLAEVGLGGGPRSSPRSSARRGAARPQSAIPSHFDNASSERRESSGRLKCVIVITQLRASATTTVLFTLWITLISVLEGLAVQDRFDPVSSLRGEILDGPRTSAQSRSSPGSRASGQGRCATSRSRITSPWPEQEPVAGGQRSRPRAPDATGMEVCVRRTTFPLFPGLERHPPNRATTREAPGKRSSGGSAGLESPWTDPAPRLTSQTRLMVRMITLPLVGSVMLRTALPGLKLRL